MSPESSAIWHTRGVANSSLTASSSSLITRRSRASSARIASSSWIVDAHVVELGLEVDAREPGQLAQLHVEDVDGLELGELERLGHQPGLGRRGVVAGPDQGDDRVDHVERLDAALEDVLAAAGLVEAELRAPGDHVDLVGDVAGQRLGQVQRARHAVDEGDHVDGEVRLQLRQLEQVVEHDVGVGVALERDDELGLAARRARR